MHDTTILIELAIAPYSLFHFDPIFYKLHVVFFKGVFREKNARFRCLLHFQSNIAKCSSFLPIFNDIQWKKSRYVLTNFYFKKFDLAKFPRKTFSSQRLSFCIISVINCCFFLSSFSLDTSIFSIIDNFEYFAIKYVSLSFRSELPPKLVWNNSEAAVQLFQWVSQERR